MTELFAWFRYQQGSRVYDDTKKWDDCQPLYTHPKEWVGLTEEERKEIWNVGEKKDQAWRALLIQAIHNIEAKLKEKNT